MKRIYILEGGFQKRLSKKKGITVTVFSQKGDLADITFHLGRFRKHR